MESQRPEILRIDHDDYHAKHIGVAADGQQFFLTTPFEPATGDQAGCEYIALFKFDMEGNIVDSTIKSLGPRATLNEEEARETYSSLLDSLGEVDCCGIDIKPFSVNYNGTDIGLIVREPEEDEDVYAVELLPGNYMAFLSHGTAVNMTLKGFA